MTALRRLRQIALIWMEVIKNGKEGMWLQLGDDMRLQAVDLGPTLRAKEAGYLLSLKRA